MFALSESPPIPAILCTYIDRINDAVLLFDKSFVTANLKGTDTSQFFATYLCSTVDLRLTVVLYRLSCPDGGDRNL